MWETMKNSEVCAFFEDELLTVVDKVGNVRFVDWTGRDRQSVPESERICPEPSLKRIKHKALPVGDEVWVLTANPHQGMSGGQMQLVRLDQELQELDRQDLYPLDQKLDYVYAGLQRDYSPHHLLTATRYFHVSFVPRDEVGTNWGHELEKGVPYLYLFWKDLPSGTEEEWELDIAYIYNRYHVVPELFLNVEVALANDDFVWLLVDLATDRGMRHALLQVNVRRHFSWMIWVSDEDGSSGGEPRILDTERFIQWGFAYRGEVGRPKEERYLPRSLPLVARSLEDYALLLPEERFWLEYPVAWPQEVLAWNGRIWMQNRGIAFWSQYPTGETSDNWHIVQDEKAVCEGLWQGQLIFRYPNGGLVALEAQLDEPEELRWLWDPEY